MSGQHTSSIVEVSEANDVCTVWMNRSEALSIDLINALTETAERLQERPRLRAVILAAKGPHFCAGVDLKDPKRWKQEPMTLAERRAVSVRGERMCQAWEDIPAITICAIEGACVGGGAALAVAMDFRVISESSQIWLPEVAIGVPLGWGALPRIIRLMGPAQAKRAIVLCYRFTGAEAVRHGLAEYLVPDGQSYGEAAKLAQRVVELPNVAVSMSKEAINVTANALNRIASFMAKDQLALAWGQEDALQARARLQEGKGEHSHRENARGIS